MATEKRTIESNSSWMLDGISALKLAINRQIRQVSRSWSCSAGSRDCPSSVEWEMQLQVADSESALVRQSPCIDADMPANNIDVATRSVKNKLEKRFMRNAAAKIEPVNAISIRNAWHPVQAISEFAIRKHAVFSRKLSESLTAAGLQLPNTRPPQPTART